MMGIEAGIAAIDLSLEQKPSSADAKAVGFPVAHGSVAAKSAHAVRPSAAESWVTMGGMKCR
jgi:hypothetical protein